MTEMSRTRTTLLRLRYGPRIDPTVTRVVKFIPHSPPHVGGSVFIDGVRHRVTRAKVTWDGPDWTLHDLRVRRSS